MNDKLIMAVISNKDDDLKYKKQQIELYFSIHPEEADRARVFAQQFMEIVNTDELVPELSEAS